MHPLDAVLPLFVSCFISVNISLYLWSSLRYLIFSQLSFNHSSFVFLHSFAMLLSISWYLSVFFAALRWSIISRVSTVIHGFLSLFSFGVKQVWFVCVMLFFRHFHLFSIFSFGVSPWYCFNVSLLRTSYLFLTFSVYLALNSDESFPSLIPFSKTMTISDMLVSYLQLYCFFLSATLS